MLHSRDDNDNNDKNDFSFMALFRVTRVHFQEEWFYSGYLITVVSLEKRLLTNFQRLGPVRVNRIMQTNREKCTVVKSACKPAMEKDGYHGLNRGEQVAFPAWNRSHSPQLPHVPEAWTVPVHILQLWNWRANRGACPPVVPHTSGPTAVFPIDTLLLTKLHGC